MTQTFGAVPDDRFSQHPNLAFDISMTDIFGALCHGATLVPLLSDADRLMPGRFIMRERITMWNSVPSVVSLMMQARQASAQHLASVRHFNFCGEPLLPIHLETLFAARPNVRLRNTYGPTEATISVTDLPLEAGSWTAEADGSVAIGPPIPGIGIHLIGGLSADEGEIVISGPQLAECYWQDAERTAQAFRKTVIDGAERRAYFTGDWAQRRGGRIFFRDRIDFQVKVRGFRIELDEIAAAIRDCGWPVACVFKWEDGLAAVIEEAPDMSFDETALRQAIGQKIEAHAVPAAIRQIARMPRNDNDKIDRKAAAAWFEQMIGNAQ